MGKLNICKVIFPIFLNKLIVYIDALQSVLLVIQKKRILPSEKFEYNLFSRPEDNRGMISFLCFTTVIYSKAQAVKMLLHPVFALVFHSENLITADTPSLLVILNNYKPLYTMASQEIKLRIQFPMS